MAELWAALDLAGRARFAVVAIARRVKSAAPVRAPAAPVGLDFVFNQLALGNGLGLGQVIFRHAPSV